MSKREMLAELDEETMLIDGLDDAIVGTFQRCGQPLVVVYDYGLCVDEFVKQGMTTEEAEEHMSFNVEGAWLGDRTPAVMHRLSSVIDTCESASDDGT